MKLRKYLLDSEGGIADGEIGAGAIDRFDIFLMGDAADDTQFRLSRRQ